MNDGEVLGFQNLREKFINYYFQKNSIKSSRKRKRNNEIEADEVNNLPIGHVIPIFGIGLDNFTNLSEKLKQIRSQNRGSYLNCTLKNGVVHFFSLFNSTFQNDLIQIKEIKKIKCEIVDQNFNRLYGFHGPPGRGVAFLFEVEYLNGQFNTLHYCLGNKCQYGCLVSSFKV